jgi:hypothetical protein
VTTATYTDLNGVQGYVQSHNYASGFFLGHFVSVNPTFANGTFHEVVVTLTPNLGPDGGGGSSLYDPAIVNQFGVQLLTQSAATDGGPSVPVNATVEVDDIWVE